MDVATSSCTSRDKVLLLTMLFNDWFYGGWFAEWTSPCNAKARVLLRKAVDLSLSQNNFNGQKLY